MAISTPVDLGFASSASSPTTLAITTTHAIAAGDCVVVWHYANSTSSGATSVTDTSGNTYNRFRYTANAPLQEVWICYNAAAMASSNSITIPSFSSSSLRHGMAAYTITGTANTTPTGAGAPTIPLDLATIGTLPSTLNQTHGTSTSASLAVLNQYNNNMIILGAVMSGASLGTFTPGGSFTQLGGGTTNATILPCYQIVSSLSPITFAPSWVSSQLFGACTIALFGPSTGTVGGGIIG